MFKKSLKNVLKVFKEFQNGKIAETETFEAFLFLLRCT